MIKLPNVKGIVLLGKAAVAAHRPEILFGASIASTIGAVVAAARGGYQSGQQVLKAEFSDLDLESPEGRAQSLTVKEKIQLTWMNYLPAAGLTAGALGSTTGLHIVHIKEKKAIAAAALMAIDEVKQQASTYVEDVKKAIEENVEMTDEQKDKVNESLLEKSADRNGGTALVQSTDGEVEELFLVRDPVTGRDIWSNKARIEEAIVEVGNLINGSGEASLNNFFEQAGWGRVDLGENLGWSGALPSITWVDQFGRPISGVRDDGRPFRSFRFQPEPEKGFDDPHR